MELCGGRLVTGVHTAIFVLKNQSFSVILNRGDSMPRGDRKDKKTAFSFQLISQGARYKESFHLSDKNVLRIESKIQKQNQLKKCKIRNRYSLPVYQSK